ncbi:MAG: hypothetical protein HYU66_27535 [Armatimonadetes bacterium]|nr:hypothetical protein [Armatimonadota bacterium]
MPDAYPGHARLLQAFEAAFAGRKYRHRDQTVGNFVAAHLFEDLCSLARSAALCQRVAERRNVLNLDQRVVGQRARRGDGAFGELVPGAAAAEREGFRVWRGPVATIEIGAEVKILAKAMMKQIDRVIGDLERQVVQFKSAGGSPLCVALVGVNHAHSYTSYEGERPVPTDGSAGFRHPAQEAPQAMQRLRELAAPAFDHFIMLPFRATNSPPYPFEWVDLRNTLDEYSAVLVRLSRAYDERFR